jgi:antitoxin component of MazEF toxin-antitoxin module
MILDPAVLRQVDIEPHAEVEVSVEDSAIVIRPRRYTDARTGRTKARRTS